MKCHNHDSANRAGRPFRPFHGPLIEMESQAQKSAEIDSSTKRICSPRCSYRTQADGSGKDNSGGRMTSRLDAFTDAAFAFAVTLLVIGGSEAPTSAAMLMAAMAEVPAFAIGFAIIAMFWSAHVRWRSYRGDGGALSVFLSVLLVFLVLIYVQPLRAMARSFATFLGGSGTPFDGTIGDLFFIYGLGFVAMAGTCAALFFEARRGRVLDSNAAHTARGEAFVFLILVATGIVSILMTRFAATANFSPLPYATLPISVGLFNWRYFFSRPSSEAAEE